MGEPEVICKTVNQAARLGLLDQVKSLIASGHPVDAADNRGWRPLHEAAARDHVTCLQQLLEQDGTDVTSGSHESFSALYLASEKGHVESVNLLLKAGSVVNQSDIMKNTPLIAAVRSGSLALVTLLLEQSADPDCQQYTGSAALHLAAADGREDIVRVLLDAGARLDVFEDYHISPVFTAAQHGQVSCLEMLLKHAETKGQPEMVSTPADDGGTPLYLAAQEGHLSCVQTLLRYGADANALTNDPVALPLHAALEFAHFQCVDVLLPVTDTSLLKFCEMSPWCLGLSHADPSCVSSLIRGGVDVNYSHRRWHFEECLGWLLGNKQLYSPKVPPLVALVVERHPMNYAEILLNAGGRVRPCGNEMPPLLAAINRGSLEYARLLLSRGAPVNEYHHHYLVNLTLTTAVFDWKMLNLLLKVGADPTLNFATRPPFNWKELCKKNPVKSATDLKSSSPRPESVMDNDSDADSDAVEGDAECSEPDTFYALLMCARPVSYKQPTPGMVLYQLLQYVAQVTLDPRMESLMEHHGDWKTLLKFTEAPRPLTHLCRLSIRQALGPHQLIDDTNLRSLTLPATIIDHLLYTELDPEEPPPK